MRVHGISLAGTTRPHNEDAMTWDESLGFVAIADGMGGHQAGEVASSLALEAMCTFMLKSAGAGDVEWPFGTDPALSAAANRLSTAIRLANQSVWSEADANPHYTGMGTTVIGLLVEGTRVTYAGVGDSRLYAWKDGVLRQLTTDDSWLVLLAQEPGMTPEILRHHPMRNVLTNVVGPKLELTVEILEDDLAGATLLLCSDGVHGVLTDEMMASIISSEPDLQKASQALVQAAMDNRSRDNVTAVLVHIDPVATGPQATDAEGSAIPEKPAVQDDPDATVASTLASILASVAVPEPALPEPAPPDEQPAGESEAADTSRE